MMSTPAALSQMPIRRASAACGSLTTETIVEEVNHWQKLRDLVKGKKANQKPPIFQLASAAAAAAAAAETDVANDGEGEITDLIAVAEKLEQLKETDFGTNFRKYSFASQGLCRRNF